MTRNVALHELRHGLAGACGLIILGADKALYDATRFHVWVSLDRQSGEFGIDASTLPYPMKGRIAELMAFGPIAAEPRAHLDLMMQREPVTAAIYRRANLSAEDLELVHRFDGPITQAGHLVRSVQTLEQGMGFGRVMKLAKLVSGIDTAELPDLPPLRALVPYTAAEKAVRLAKLELFGRGRKAA